MNWLKKVKPKNLTKGGQYNLYAILVIEIENLNNYYVKEIIENLLKLSLKFNRLDIYYQVIFYRGLYKNYKCSPSFYNDIDESLMDLYLTKNNILFKHDIQFLNNINLIKTYWLIQPSNVGIF